MTAELVAWLREEDPRRLALLWRQADEARRQHVGDQVHLRGLVEISNYCGRACAYCGLRAEHRALERYRLTADEILQCAAQAVALGYGTLVLQSGEDFAASTAWISALVRRIKHETPLAVTLSLGERLPEELAAWRAAGADRYLLRFETSNRQLFERLHPARPGQPAPDRPTLLRVIRQLGYEVGSGVMIGIPGQSFDDLARDIRLFQELDLDMIGVGPFLLHPATPLADPACRPPLPATDQVPSSELMTCKMIALTRLACPRANIPATTALAALSPDRGRARGLQRGANVIMPNLTPAKYRRLYDIYPNKACLSETADACRQNLAAYLLELGRAPGLGRGDAPNFIARGEPTSTP